MGKRGLSTCKCKRGGGGGKLKWWGSKLGGGERAKRIVCSSIVWLSAW